MIPTKSNLEFKDAIEKVGQFKLAAAFNTATFVYGTAGQGSKIVSGLHNWAKKTAANKQSKGFNRKLNLFDPGRRAEIYLREGHQMMDLYYGQGGTSLHTKRIPAIAAFVHYAMGYEGDFVMSRSGRDEYLHHFKTGVEGYDPISPSCQEYKGLTATKEISRIIRWGIATFGGTLIFEGREVYYSQVFDTQAPRCGDTDLEAQELFKYFKPGSSIAKFDKGRIIFHWNGIQTIPTQTHFLTNWVWSNNLHHKKGNFFNDNLAKHRLRPIWHNFRLL